MAVVNARTKEINAKIVFYGPGHSGKTTNLKKVHTLLKPEVRGKLMALSTQSDRTIFFDYLPVDLGSVRGMQMKIQLYTVPGQVFYNSTRRLVLKNVDGVVFVADSSRRALPDNLESLANLQENLQVMGRSLDEIPWVIQYNKRDAEDAMPVAQLREKLNRWNVPEFEATAETGHGVMTTLTGVTKLVVKQLTALAPPVPDTVSAAASITPIATKAAPRLTFDDLPTPQLDVPADRPVRAAVPTYTATPSAAPAIAQPEPPKPSPAEIDAMIARDKSIAQFDASHDVRADAEEVEVDTSDLVEEIEPEEEIRIELRDEVRWDNGVLVLPIVVTIDGSEFVREFKVRLNPKVETEHS